MMGKNLLFVCFSICSSTFLWRIERSPPGYIFGSIHVPYDLVWPYVSKETRQAFLSSTHFYAEIDAKNDEFWDDFLQCIVNRSRRVRRSNHSTYVLDMLDVHLSVEARRLNKTVGSLETAQSHCERESGRFDLETWRFVIDRVKKQMKNSTLRSNDLKELFPKSVIKKYICDELTGRYIQSQQTIKNGLQYIEQRDEDITRYIHSLFQHSKDARYFFVVGTAHMIGKHQTLKVRLRKLGYQITRVCTNRKRIKKKFGCKKRKTPNHCRKKTY